LSPLGERVKLKCSGLRTAESAGIEVLVQTADPTRAPAPGQPWPTLTRTCTDVQFEDANTLSAVVPGSTFPTQAWLFVRDEIAGQSTIVHNAYYRPDIALALPSQGPTTGGSLVTLIGTALLPLNFDASSGKVTKAFNDFELSFAKGARVTKLPLTDFRPAESGTDRLVFTMPVSPDGRPGQVDIVLSVFLGNVKAQTAASQVFLFANPKPFFGPRGMLLDRTPVAVTPLLLDAPYGEDSAPDFGVLTDSGGVAFLQLLLSQQNGMFRPFGAPRQIGDHEVAAERVPRDICSGDFSRDGVPDMLIVNRGSAAAAVHHLVLGRAPPDTPLGAVYKIAGAPGTARCRVADFDNNGRPDVLLVPGPDAPPGRLPQVMLANPAFDPDSVPWPSAPQFFHAPIDIAVRPLLHEAFELADLDGDGILDVGFLRGDTLQLDIAYGNGDGTFGSYFTLDFQIPGYTASPQSRAVGLHACRNGPTQSLAIVLAGLPGPAPGASQTPPTLAVLAPSIPRSYAPPAPQAVTLLPVGLTLGLSLFENVDELGEVEIVLASGGEPDFFGMLRLVGETFELVPGAVEGGTEVPRQISALHFGRAFPPLPTSPEARAVFVVHESEIDGFRERWLSTRLVFSDPDLTSLLPPDAGGRTAEDIEGLVAGDFHPISVAGDGLVRDLALSRADWIELKGNDGFGGIPLPSTQLNWPGLLPRSVALVPVPGQIDLLVFANTDSRLGLWRHDVDGPAVQVPNWVSGELRLRSGNPAHPGAMLSNATRIQVADVDGDGVLDLVVLLSFDNVPIGSDGAQIALLRGKASSDPDEFPFHEPTLLTPVHSNASSIALGDFAPSTSASTRLELAVAVPVGSEPGGLDGDHVRFFRYLPGATPAEDVFEPSAKSGGPQVLLAGSGPTEIAAADFDRDGLVDLLTAGAGDFALRVLRNVSPPGSGQPHVDIGAFVENLASPDLLPPGVPTFLRPGDINGDGKIDAVVATEFTSQTGVRSTSVVFLLNSGAGEFSEPEIVSPARVGNRNGRLAMDIGDWNRDEVPDLFLGWPAVPPPEPDRNLRVLFGGTK
jgi:hypothetical protein